MSEPLLQQHQFGTAKDYHELNAGAHRNPPKNLNAPALVWHVAFWTKTDQNKSDPSQIKRTLDTFILALCGTVATKVGAVELSPCISNVRLLFDCVCRDTSFVEEAITLDDRQRDVFESTRRAVSVKFKWRDLDLSIRFEIHTEFFSISTFIELDKERKGAPYSELPALNENIRRIRDYFESGDKDLAVPIGKYFFRDFWQSYENEILSNASLKPLMQANPFKQVFADFRGLILSEQVVRFPGTEDFLAKDAPLIWGGAAKSKFLPLFQDQRRYECAVNYVLDGRAFYMSTLGPQLPSIQVTDRIPLEFIVYANQRSLESKTIVNKWQLGRVVGRLLHLGTLRLCALRHVTLLHEAGRELAQLDESTQKAREAIAAIETKKTGTALGRSEIDNEKVMELIGAAHKKLNDITGEFLKKTGNGLLYRIERSRYYVKQFYENADLLRAVRLEGDQPYDQFIRRRLGSEFDFIDRLGIRYERATRNMVTLDQNYLSMKANQIDEDIHTIQKYGELFLLGALVPYYVTHLLVLICGDGFSLTIAANVWIAFIAVAIANFFKVPSKIRKALGIRELIEILAIVLLVAGFYLGWPFEAMFWNRQHEGQEQKQKETAEVGILKRVLERLSSDDLRVVPAIDPGAPKGNPAPNSRATDKAGN